MKKKILLVSGFTPFSHFRYNPGQELLPLLEGNTIGNWTIRTVLLHTAFSTSFATLRENIDRIHPHAVICLGMHPGSNAIKLETRACNLRQSIDRKNGENATIGLHIDPHGEQFRISNWPLPQRLPDPGPGLLDVRFSFFAGTYICNELYYHLLGYLNTRSNAQLTYGLFVHIPPFPGDVEANRNGVNGATIFQLYRGLLSLFAILLP